MGSLHDTVTWYKIRHAGWQKMQQPPKQSDFHRPSVACHPAGQTLYHVTASCKGPIGIGIVINEEHPHYDMMSMWNITVLAETVCEAQCLKHPTSVTEFLGQVQWPAKLRHHLGSSFTRCQATVIKLFHGLMHLISFHLPFI